MPALRPGLKTLLIAPYLAVILATAVFIGLLSYRAGSNAVNNLSGQLLQETVHRIGQAVEKHVSGSAAVLETAFPQGVPAPDDWPGSLEGLRTRFWLATSVHRDPNNYAYYGDLQGRFFGLWRHSETDAELRLRTTGQGPREIHRFSGIAGALGPTQPEQRVFDPRERPWFRAAQNSAAATWTSIYIDFKTSELVATRARRVNNSQGQLAGVVATDLSLQRVSAFLQRLGLSKNGLALVAEEDGQLIGVSRGPHLRKVNGQNTRLNAAQSEDPLVVAAYAAVLELGPGQVSGEPQTAVFKGPDGQLVQMGYSRLQDEAGLNWLVMVAVPRNDFLGEVEGGFRTAALLGLMAAIGVALIGLAVMGVLTRELAALSAAVKRVSSGDLSQPLTSERRDELGELARSFGNMQRRLLTDQLTGLSNREAVLRHLEERVQQHRRRADNQPFAVIFVDLNAFKQVNDRYGHDVGDAVLRELGQRLRNSVRGEDIVARYAGDEFVVCLSKVNDRSDAETARSHIEAALRGPLAALANLQPTPEPGSAGGSCGLAVFPTDGQDVQSLLKAADEDMYRRKPRG